MGKYLWPLITLAAFAVGLFIASANWFGWSEQQSQIEATTILDRIEKVTKLVTVNGYFSEVYDYKDYYGYDWPIFRKKALIRVKAKVLAGFDLESINVTADSKSKVISISNLPDPEILSIDHTLDYYDITEGTFNSFSKEDLNKVNEQAKSYIEQAAKTSSLLHEAKQKGNDMLGTIRFLVEGAGWTLVVAPDISHGPN